MGVDSFWVRALVNLSIEGKSATRWTKNLKGEQGDIIRVSCNYQLYLISLCLSQLAIVPRFNFLLQLSKIPGGMGRISMARWVN